MSYMDYIVAPTEVVIWDSCSWRLPENIDCSQQYGTKGGPWHGPVCPSRCVIRGPAPISQVKRSLEQACITLRTQLP